MKILKYKKITLASLGIISGLTLASPLVMYGADQISKNKNTKDLGSVATNMNFVGATRAAETKKVDPNEILNSAWYDEDYVAPSNFDRENYVNINFDAGNSDTQGTYIHKIPTVISLLNKNTNSIFAYQDLLKKLDLGFNNSSPSIVSVNEYSMSIQNHTDVKYYQNYTTKTVGGGILDPSRCGWSHTGSQWHQPSCYTPGTSVTTYIPQAFQIGEKLFEMIPKTSNNTSKIIAKAAIDLKFNISNNSRVLDHFDENQFSLDKLLMVNEQKTFRTFETNQLKIEPNNEYLKSLFFMANSVAKANELVKSSTVEQRSDEQWLAIVNALASGKIIDETNNELKLLDITIKDFGGIANSLGYLLTKLNSGYDVINDINNIPGNKYQLYAEQNNINVTDAYLAHKLNVIFFKNVSGEYYDALKFKINIKYPNDDIQKEVNIKYQPNSKNFVLLDDNKEFLLFKNESSEVNQQFGISNIDLLSANSNVAAQQSSNIGILYKNSIWKKSAGINILEIQSTFDSTKLINFKENWTLDDLEEVKGKPLTKNEIEKPSLLFNDDHFVKELLDFKKFRSWGTAALNIVDPVIVNQANKVEGDSLVNNSKLQYYFKDYKVEAFDSVNGIEVKFDYKWLDRRGVEISKPNGTVTEKIVRFQTSVTEGEDFGNNVENPVINNYEYDDTKTPEENVLENLISYNGENKTNVLLKTEASFNDWTRNSLVNDKVVNENNSLSGFIEYKVQADANGWLAQDDLKKSKNVFRTTIEKLDFNVSFAGGNTIGSPSAKKASEDMTWTIVGALLGSAVLLFGAATTYWMMRKRKIAKYIGEDLTDLEDDI